ncbi:MULTISPECIES: lipid-A-disaccharide synthase-related protein [Prochlorococcus]|uniref:lipid-A-disaccharide synthase-related protein n=1 Tax=Prochlorococcus TaxID=1218 RepID=UPI0009DE0380
MQSSALPLGHAAEYQNDFTFEKAINQPNKEVLVLSNGHGEDLIALRILEAIHDKEPELNLEVLPLVGEGHVFASAIAENWLVKKGPIFRLPSGGFSNQSLTGFFSDVFAGLFYFTLKHWVYVRRSVLSGKTVLAVGDLLPLFFAWSTGGLYGFVGTPKSDYTWATLPSQSLSDYYHRLKGSEWDPWEWVLMRSNRCKFVAVRDHLTARGLARQSINVIAPGNPMMDGFLLNECPNELKSFRCILLLCGSRMPEALKNFRRLMSSALLIRSKKPLAILVTVGTEPSLFEIEDSLKTLGFLQASSVENTFHFDSSWRKGLCSVFIGVKKFQDWAAFAEIGLANAGTATEQLVGLGTPCLSLPGSGPQFKKSFAIRQSRLLGGAVIPCRSTLHLAESAELLLNDEALRSDLSNRGIRRMGCMGGSSILASFVLKFLIRY